jgi:hypothetical protein
VHPSTTACCSAHTTTSGKLTALIRTTVKTVTTCMCKFDTQAEVIWPAVRLSGCMGMQAPCEQHTQLLCKRGPEVEHNTAQGPQCVNKQASKQQSLWAVTACLAVCPSVCLSASASAASQLSLFHSPCCFTAPAASQLLLLLHSFSADRYPKNGLTVGFGVALYCTCGM